MKAEPQSTDFIEYERVLWRVLLSMTKSGFFVPLDDARDLIHDFYVEAWEGLLTRFDPTIANFTTYVAGAFYRFARRRTVQMDQTRRRLLDLEDLGDLISTELEPAGAYEKKQQIDALRSALRQLSNLERSILIEHFGDEALSERELAVRHALTRYAVRSKLTAALEHLAMSIAPARPPPVGREAVFRREEEERFRMSTVPKVGPRPDLVPNSRSRPVTRLEDTSRRGAITLDETKEKSMDAKDRKALHAALLEGNDHAYSYLAKNAVRLRSLIADTDDLVLEPAEIEILRNHPERLSRFYELLLPDETVDEVSAAESAIERARQQSAVEIGEAFELMAEGLPSEMVQWGKWFPLAQDNAEYREYLALQPSVTAGGHFARELTHYAMTPDTFAGAMRGLQLLFDEILESDIGQEVHLVGQVPFLLLTGSDKQIQIGLEQVEAQIATGPFLPRLPDISWALTKWLASLVQQRPYFVPGYLFEPRADDVRLARLLPELERENRKDLRALWTRPAPWQLRFSQLD